MAAKKQVPSTELAIPEIGEVVNLSDPDSCALAYDRLKQLGDQVNTLKQMLRTELVRHAKDYGANTMRLDHAEVEIGHPSELSWHMETLRELLDAGLPKERWEALVEVTVGHKVKASVANQIEKANPLYGEIIERARIRQPKPPTVSVALRATS